MDLTSELKRYILDNDYEGICKIDRIPDWSDKIIWKGMEILEGCDVHRDSYSMASQPTERLPHRALVRQFPRPLPANFAELPPQNRCKQATKMESGL